MISQMGAAHGGIIETFSQFNFLNVKKVNLFLEVFRAGILSVEAELAKIFLFSAYYFD